MRADISSNGQGALDGFDVAIAATGGCERSKSDPEVLGLVSGGD
jgi:hypothetical protein